MPSGHFSPFSMANDGPPSSHQLGVTKGIQLQQIPATSHGEWLGFKSPLAKRFSLVRYPLVMTNIAIENGHGNSWFTQLQNGGSFHSYVNVYQRVCNNSHEKSNSWNLWIPTRRTSSWVFDLVILGSIRSAWIECSGGLNKLSCMKPQNCLVLAWSQLTFIFVCAWVLKHQPEIWF